MARIENHLGSIRNHNRTYNPPQKRSKLHHSQKSIGVPPSGRITIHNPSPRIAPSHNVDRPILTRSEIKSVNNDIKQLQLEFSAVTNHKRLSYGKGRAILFKAFAKELRKHGINPDPFIGNRRVNEAIHLVRIETEGMRGQNELLLKLEALAQEFRIARGEAPPSTRFEFKLQGQTAITKKHHITSVRKQSWLSQCLTFLKNLIVRYFKSERHDNAFNNHTVALSNTIQRIASQHLQEQSKPTFEVPVTRKLPTSTTHSPNEQREASYF